MPPVFMIEVINALAYKIYAEVRLLKEQDKVEMLQYFREWGGVEPHELLSSLEKVIDINYDHNNIDQHLADVLNVVDKLKIIWSKLCTLDYIGQRKENIVLKEEQLTGVSTDTKGYAILG